MGILRLVGVVALACASCGDNGSSGVDAHVNPVVVMLSTAPKPAEFVAFQDGDGPWQAISPTNGATYEHTITTGRYGVAVVCASSFPLSWTSTRILYALTSEATSLRRGCIDDTSMPVRVSGNVIGLATGDTSQITFGGLTSGGTSSSTYSFAIAPGMYRPLAARIDSTGDTVEVIRLGSQSITTGTMIDFDFDAGGAPLDRHELTVTGLEANESVFTVTDLSDDVGTALNLVQIDTMSWRTLPSSLAVTGDLYGLYAEARSPGRSRWVYRTLATGAAQTITPPAAVTTSGATIVSTSPIRLQASVEALSSAQTYDQFASQYVQYVGMLVTVLTTMTAGYVGTGVSADLVQPDFTTLVGWNPEWNFRAGTEIGWDVSAGWTNADLTDSINFMRVAGSESQGADAIGVVTP